MHTFLFAAFPVLFLYAYNIYETSPDEVISPLAIILAGAFGCWLLLSLILKNRRKAGILASLLIVLFFSYGHVYSVIEGFGFSIGDTLIGENKILFPVWCMLILMGGYLCLKARGSLIHITKTLNVVSASLVVMSLIAVGFYMLGKSNLPGLKEEEPFNSGFETTIREDSFPPENSPDIYYIILDGYASADTLRDLYDYDNREFINWLEKKGFYVVPESRSNYVMTFLSLASSLNMEYINSLSEIVGEEARDFSIPIKMIENNRVINFLKNRGYKYVHVNSSGFGPTKRNRNADLVVECGIGGEFLTTLVKTTMLSILEDLLKREARNRTLAAFSKLGEIPDLIEGPHFVFAHLLVPHPPFIFNSQGEMVIQSGLDMAGNIWKRKDLYVNQLIFVNKKVKALIDTLLAKNGVPPIIILQADHGAASTGVSADQWGQPGKELFKERLGILNAYYLPDDGDGLLYESITPVNTFRLIFSSYFNSRYDLLEDNSYFSTYERPYQFVDVTEIVAEK